MHIGERIRKFRKQLGLTQQDLGRKLGVRYTQVGTWERGEHTPRPETMPQLAAALGVSVAELMGQPDDEALDLLNFLRRHLDPSTLRALSELVEGSSEEDLEALRDVLRQYPRSRPEQRQAIRVILRGLTEGDSGRGDSKSA